MLHICSENVYNYLWLNNLQYQGFQSENKIMSASTQLASASTMDRLSLYMGTCCRIWIGLYLALCCLTSVTSLMLHVAAVGLLLCILSYFRLPAPEPGEVFRILGKLFFI